MGLAQMRGLQTSFDAHLVQLGMEIGGDSPAEVPIAGGRAEEVMGNSHWIVSRFVSRLTLLQKGKTPALTGVCVIWRREWGCRVHPCPDPDARCTSGPACGGPVLLLQNRRTPAWLLTTHPIRQTNAKGPPCGRPFCVCLAERGAASAMIHSVSRRINNPWSPAFPTLSLHLVASLNSMSLHHLMLGQMWGQGCQRRSLSHSLPSRFLS